MPNISTLGNPRGCQNGVVKKPKEKDIINLMILDLIYPKRCVNCQASGDWICNSCLQKIKPNFELICPECNKLSPLGQTHKYCLKRNSLDGLVRVLKYQGATRKIVHQLKYRRIKTVAKILSDLVYKNIKTQPQFRIFLSDLKNKKPALTALPLHWFRKNWRGFNQSEEVAKLLAKKLDLEFQANLIKRTKFTWPQTSVSKEERLKNVKNIFEININRSRSWANSVLNKNIVLVDDVWTTGETMRQAGKALKKAGFKWVWGLALCG